MRIAISGAVSTGKTTLGKALAEKFNLPFIGENLAPLFGKNAARRKNTKDVANAVVACLKNKRILETKTGNFIVDRSPLDLMNFWQSAQLPKMCGGHDFTVLCESYMTLYDFVVLTPFEGVPFVQDASGADKPRRVMDPWVQFKGSVRITGLAHHFLEPSKIIQIPAAMSAHEERLAFVLDNLHSRNDDNKEQPIFGDFH